MVSANKSRPKHPAWDFAPHPRSLARAGRHRGALLSVAVALLAFAQAYQPAPAFGLGAEEEDILTRAELAGKWVARSALAVATRYEWSDHAGQHSECDYAIRHYVSSDAGIHTRITTTIYAADGKPTATTRMEIIFADDKCAVYIPGYQVMLSKTPERVNMLRATTYCDASIGAFLEGRLRAGDAGNASVFDLARQGNAKLLAQTEQVDGIECRVLHAETPAMDVRLWVAPSMGYNLAKFIVNQKDLTGKKFKKFRAVFDHAEFKQQGSHFLACKGRLQTESVTSSAQESGYSDLSETFLVSRTCIDTDPQFAEPDLFTFKGITNGTKVRFDDDPAAAGPFYVWRDGQPVPFVDDKATESIRKEIDAYQQSATAGQIPQPDNATTPTALPHNSTNLWIALAAAVLAATIVGAGYALARRKIA